MIKTQGVELSPFQETLILILAGEFLDDEDNSHIITDDVKEELKDLFLKLRMHKSVLIEAMQADEGDDFDLEDLEGLIEDAKLIGITIVE